MTHLRKALTSIAAFMLTTQFAVADMSSPPWPSANVEASAFAEIGDSVYSSQVSLDGDFNYEHSFPNPQATDQAYSKINVQNAPPYATGYYTNFYGYYETYGTASSYEYGWTISGTYDFAGLQNQFLQFGVNTNPDRPLDVPVGGLITFNLHINGQAVPTPGYPHDPGWKFTHGMLGQNLWSDTQQNLGETGTWRLDILFNGATGGSPQPAQRFDAWLGVVNTLAIPAPGPLALLGIAGFGLRRRRC